MKYLNMNFKKKILFPSAFNGKFIKYDAKVKSVITDSTNDSIEENFKNKNVLVIFPYPCKINLIISQRKIKYQTL